jgi:hypothetical protein
LAAGTSLLQTGNVCTKPLGFLFIVGDLKSTTGRPTDVDPRLLGQLTSKRAMQFVAEAVEGGQTVRRCCWPREDAKTGAGRCRLDVDGIFLAYKHDPYASSRQIVRDTATDQATTNQETGMGQGQL